MADVGNRIGDAVDAARLTQRELEARTGISQSTLNRIITGKRIAKMPEIVAIAQATGRTVAQLTGLSTAADRVQCAARATNGADMTAMREALLRFVEMNDYLDDQAVPAVS